MKTYSRNVGLVVTVAYCFCLAASASAQVGGQRSAGFSMGKATGTFGSPNQDDGYRSYPQSEKGGQQTTITSAAGSRSVSFMQNGKRVSITESGAGISVTGNGRRLRAKNADELKKKFPHAYRLYNQNIGAAQARASARADRVSSASSAAIGTGLPRQSSNTSIDSRSVSVMDNGKKVSITQDRKGISVSSRGKRVRAKNAAELKERFPDAFKLFEKHTRSTIGETNDGADSWANGGASGWANGGANGWAKGGGNAGLLDANALLRKELDNLRQQDSVDPIMKRLLEGLLRELPR